MNSCAAVMIFYPFPRRVGKQIQGLENLQVQCSSGNWRMKLLVDKYLIIVRTLMSVKVVLWNYPTSR